jgi:hypothetical protein
LTLILKSGISGLERLTNSVLPSRRAKFRKDSQSKNLKEIKKKIFPARPGLETSEDIMSQTRVNPDTGVIEESDWLWGWVPKED